MNTAMKIEKLASAETWYICHGFLMGVRLSGYGTTMANAIDDACRTYQQLIKK